jgi:hypothetical protein
MSDSLIWQSVRAALGLGQRAIEEVRALKAAPPPVARFPVVEPWTDRVHYEGSVVACGGATWQATRDTGREPPHEDWALLAAPGATGRDGGGEVCGLFDPAREYRKYDLVMLNGSEWRAKRDAPGPLPGDGWAMSAQQGKAGKPGEKGERGPAGSPATAIVGWQISEFRAVPVLSDGGLGPPLDLRAMFEQYHGEAS